MTMQAEFVYPPVMDKLLNEMVRRMRAAGDPLKIVLFGPRARGAARPDSGIDLLVIEESDLPREGVRRTISARSSAYSHRKTSFVWTPAGVQEWANMPNTFITTALREGRVLYERPG